MKFATGESVLYREGEEKRAGVVIEGFTGPFTAEIAGREVSGEGTNRNPAYLISLAGLRRIILREDVLEPAR